MGSGESKTVEERTAVVRRSESKDGEITVHISEELLQDIQTKNSANPPTSGVIGVKAGQTVGSSTELPTQLGPTDSNGEEARIKLLQDLEEERLKNKEYKAVTLAEIGQASREIGQKISSTPLSQGQPICLSLAGVVAQCYRENQGRSMNCSQLVQDYRACVEKQMKERFLRS